MKQVSEKEELAMRVFKYLKPKFKYDPCIKMACKRKGTTISNMLRIINERLWLLSLESLKMMDHHKAENYLELRKNFIEISFMDNRDILSTYKNLSQTQH